MPFNPTPFYKAFFYGGRGDVGRQQSLQTSDPPAKTHGSFKNNKEVMFNHKETDQT